MSVLLLMRETPRPSHVQTFTQRLNLVRNRSRAVTRNFHCSKRTSSLRAMRIHLVYEDGSPSAVSETITGTEIIVVCLSYLFAIMSVLLRFKGEGNPKDPLWIPISNLLLIFISITISLVALVMAVTNTISIDAMAVATIGLLPSLHLLRRTQFQELVIRWLVFWRVYGGTEGMFLYYRIRTERSGFGQEHGVHKRLHIIYYQHQAPFIRIVRLFKRMITLRINISGTHKHLTRLLSDPNVPKDEKEEKAFWTGHQFEPSKSGIVLTQSYHYGGAWFEIERVLGGHRLATDPSKVHAGTSKSVIRGLCALTEIILIGDLCRHFFEARIDREYRLLLNNDRYHAAMSFCIQTLRNLDLIEQWGIRQKHENMPLEQQMFYKTDRTRYNIFKNLFFILTVKSRKFKDKNKYAATYVSEMLHKGANGESLLSLETAVEAWLESYGYIVKPKSTPPESDSISTMDKTSQPQTLTRKNIRPLFSLKWLKE